MWNKKIKRIKSCDLNHFLYIIASLCTDNIEFKETLLPYLHTINMNGLLFTSINKTIFTQSITKHINKADNKYVSILYDKISKFDMKTMNQATICTIKFIAFHQVKIYFVIDVF